MPTPAATRARSTAACPPAVAPTTAQREFGEHAQILEGPRERAPRPGSASKDVSRPHVAAEVEPIKAAPCAAAAAAEECGGEARCAWRRVAPDDHARGGVPAEPSAAPTANLGRRRRRRQAPLLPPGRHLLRRRVRLRARRRGHALRPRHDTTSTTPLPRSRDCRGATADGASTAPTATISAAATAAATLATAAAAAATTATARSASTAAPPPQPRPPPPPSPRHPRRCHRRRLHPRLRSHRHRRHRHTRRPRHRRRHRRRPRRRCPRRHRHRHPHLRRRVRHRLRAPYMGRWRRRVPWRIGRGRRARR